MLMIMQAASAPSGMAALVFNTIPVLLIVVIMWFLLFRPQQQRIKQHQADVASLKKGDDVVTGGGIRARVTKVTDDEAEIEIAQGVKVRVVKSTISQVIRPSARPAND
jgi:preprotein translocase subunit YajC